jgi:hypothetical protein
MWDSPGMKEEQIPKIDRVLLKMISEVRKPSLCSPVSSFSIQTAESDPGEISQVR